MTLLPAHRRVAFIFLLMHWTCSRLVWVPCHLITSWHGTAIIPPVHPAQLADAHRQAIWSPYSEMTIAMFVVLPFWQLDCTGRDWPYVTFVSYFRHERVIKFTSKPMILDTENDVSEKQDLMTAGKPAMCTGCPECRTGRQPEQTWFQLTTNRRIAPPLHRCLHRPLPYWWYAQFHQSHGYGYSCCCCSRKWVTWAIPH